MSDIVPASRIIARNAPLPVVDLKSPGVREWLHLEPIFAAANMPAYASFGVFVFNKQSALERFCPCCRLLYRSLPNAEATAIGHIEQERRLSGLCSVSCYQKFNAGTEFGVAGGSDWIGRSGTAVVDFASGTQVVTRDEDDVTTMITMPNGIGKCGKGTTATTFDAKNVNLSAVGSDDHKSPTEKRKCDVCGGVGSDGGVQLCSSCKGRCFCGRECQRRDWRSHKESCRRIKATLDAAAAFHQEVKRADKRP
jgi:hypothetical protein